MKKLPKIFALATACLGAMLLVSCASPKTENSANSAPKNENAAPAKTETTAVNPAEPIKIAVSTNFEPKSVEVKKGQPVTLAFLRKDDKNCGEEVVFPKLGIRKKLPVGETVTVELTPQESGEIAFTCGMDMMRGKVIVSE